MTLLTALNWAKEQSNIGRVLHVLEQPTGSIKVVYTLVGNPVPQTVYLQS